MATKPTVAELVERMPATDKELEARKAPPPIQDPAKAKPKSGPGREQSGSKSLGRRIDGPDDLPGDLVRGGSKFTAPDPDVAEKVFDEILAGGHGSLTELIGLIRDPAADDFQNYKAEYVCHGLAVYVGREGKDGPRRLLVDTFAAQLGNGQLAVHTRGFLVRELRLIGDQAAVPALGKLLADESLCSDAASTLVAISQGAAEQLRNALPGATAKCRLILVQNLAVLRDAQSLSTLRQAVSDDDRDVRLAAAWGLARIGDANSTDLLLKAADVSAPWERNKATQACLVLAETLAAAGQKTEAAKIYTHLRNTRTDPKEQYIRDAATKALKDLSGKVA